MYTLGNRIKNRLTLFTQGIVNLLYPPICLHCRNLNGQAQHPLCEECVCLLEPIDHLERCSYCFAPHELLEKGPCHSCRKLDQILHGVSSVFDYVGPAASLVKRLKYANQPYLAKGCGAYMAAQFLKMEWPFPDLIIPVPTTFGRQINRGYNQSYLLSNSLAELLKCSVKEALVREDGDYSQAGLSHAQRLLLSGKTIKLKKNQELQDKCILLVDDVLTTGSTLKKCAEALREECPAKIYAMTFCRAL